MNFINVKIIDCGRVTNTHGFGRVPDPPEPLSDEWFEDHCPRCKYNREWQENGKWYAECTEGGCTGFVEREDEE
jgi:hypothetical protein